MDIPEPEVKIIPFAPNKEFTNIQNIQKKKNPENTKSVDPVTH